jgi:hypothetical protein
MSPDFEMLTKHLREHTAEVELDLPAPVASPDPRAAQSSREVGGCRSIEETGLLASASLPTELRKPARCPDQRSTRW